MDWIIAVGARDSGREKNESLAVCSDDTDNASSRAVNQGENQEFHSVEFGVASATALAENARDAERARGLLLIASRLTSRS